MTNVRDHFVESVMGGAEIETALESAAAQATMGGLREILHQSGTVGFVGSLSAGIVGSTSSASKSFRSVFKGRGGIADIPTAACLRSHLPKEGKPTREELMDAWRLCQQK